jgi:hypothetical protein
MGSGDLSTNLTFDPLSLDDLAPASPLGALEAQGANQEAASARRRLRTKPEGAPRAEELTSSTEESASGDEKNDVEKQADEENREENFAGQNLVSEPVSIGPPAHQFDRLA